MTRRYGVEFNQGGVLYYYADQVLTPGTGFLFDRNEGDKFFLFHAYDNPETKEGWHLVAALSASIVKSIEIF